MAPGGEGVGEAKSKALAGSPRPLAALQGVLPFKCAAHERSCSPPCGPRLAGASAPTLPPPVNCRATPHALHPALQPAMHQVVYDVWQTPPAAHCRSTRARKADGGRGAGKGGALSLAVLTSDPLMELVYRSGLLSIRDLRALMCCTGSEVGGRGQLDRGAVGCIAAQPCNRRCGDARQRRLHASRILGCNAATPPAAPPPPRRPSEEWPRSAPACASPRPPTSCALCGAPLSCAPPACGGWRSTWRRACCSWGCPCWRVRACPLHAACRLLPALPSNTQRLCTAAGGLRNPRLLPNWTSDAPAPAPQCTLS